MNRGETPEERRFRIWFMALIYLVLGLFVLTFIKGSLTVMNCLGNKRYVNYYYLDPYTILSGIFTGITLIFLFSFAGTNKPDRLAICTVLLEMAVLLCVFDWVMQILRYPPLGLTPLSFGIATGQTVAAVIAYRLYRSAVADQPQENVFSRREMGISCLLIALALALSFVPWSIVNSEDGIVTVVYSLSNYGTWVSLTPLLIAIALNLALAFAVGLLHGRPVVTGLLLLAAAILPFTELIRPFGNVTFGVLWLCPLPDKGMGFSYTLLALAISLLLLALALRFLFGKMRKVE